MSDCVAELTPEANVKTSQQFEDLELTRRSQAGDTEAFDKLVTKYRVRIFTMVCGIVRNEHDAWDLAQEGFLKAWHSIHLFRGRSSFYSWLYSITVNLTIYSLRRQGRCVEVELNLAKRFLHLFPVPALTINALRFGNRSMPLWQGFLQSIALL